MAAQNPQRIKTRGKKGKRAQCKVCRRVRDGNVFDRPGGEKTKTQTTITN